MRDIPDPIRVLLDLVPNHTSARQPWFHEARADPAGPRRDYCIWRDAPPNNWVSMFNGPAWSRDPASGAYYRRLGELVGIQGIPSRYPEFAAYLGAYEREHHVFAETNRRVALDAIAIFASWFHPALRPVVRRCVIVPLGQPLRRTRGLRDPGAPARVLVHLGLRGRAAMARALPRRRGDVGRKHARPIRSYPDGYALQDLGPVLPAASSGGCPRFVADRSLGRDAAA